MEIIQYAIVFSFGLLVGVAELLTRYRDSPISFYVRWHAISYLVINGAASAFALFMIDVNNFSFTNNAQVEPVWRILVAGFSATLFLRSSLFTLRVGSQDIQTGPAGILNAFLDAADRAFDRRLAERRGDVVEKIMAGVDFEKAKVALPTLCFNLMQNVSEQEQSQFGHEIDILMNNKHIDDKQKSLVLGLTLIRLTGERLLEKAVRIFKDQREPDPAPSP